ncbi:HAMP domain-containing protein [Deinococcus soli (ex Cha et al. 2016)]|uniref:HAMP domain-containing protein n=1 Tax=Deinococcus soli (ex Cha et al. 2016) TaxID=1309411 RepID=UPI0016649A5E|nr:HAMP domain-containing protein [Deinococcus soli (ex Cha et al. 2016)]GGB76448.1 hypothetical protein GCM10008019_35810 [Deinococcus soli (ex Cha et al. 2016)]
MTTTAHPDLSTLDPARPAPRRSIGTFLLALTLLPATAVGVTWAGSTLLTQAPQHRALLLQGGTQTAQAFSDRILDLGEQSGQDLTSPELRAGVQVRAEDLLRSGTLPVTDVAVTDRTGQVVVAYDRSLGAGTGAAEENIVTRWQAKTGTLAPDVQALARAALKADRPLTRTLPGRGVTLTATPITGGAGVTVLALDEAVIQRGVRASLVQSIVLLGVVLLAATVAASLVARRLITRIQQLTQAAQAVSEGELDTPIPITGRDELTTLSESVDRLAESSRIALSRL